MSREAFGNALKSILVQNYTTADKLLKQCVESDNKIISRKSLLLYFKDTKEVGDISSEEVEWIKKMADKGNSYAQNSLGYMYLCGFGIEKDYKEAIKWYGLSTDQYNSYAQNNLRYMYHYGNGVKRNYKEAVKWYRLAAKRGVIAAQDRLDEM